uniref:tyrosine-type recombinase/integrase n=1 Tax=Salmonella enterica TaxID=28901 RepID=UPI001481FA05
SHIRDKPMFLMAYQHGLRVSELTGIRISDLDLQDKTVYIKRLKNGFSTIHPLQNYTIELIKKCSPFILGNVFTHAISHSFHQEVYSGVSL